MPSNRTSRHLYTASLLCLVLLIVVCLAISAADVIIQALEDRTATGYLDYRNLFVVTSSYVLLKVHSHIQNEFIKVKEIQTQCHPLSASVPSTGKSTPDMLFDGVDFKRAISRTPAIIESAAIKLDTEYARPHYVPVRQYMEFLMQRKLVDFQLGRVYLEGYERARFSCYPMSQEEYLDIMKHLAVMLHHMGFYFNLNSQ
ncbi:hypothetical protein BDF14DRAFT_1697521, partial [Spinellus fusiger]